MGSIITKEKKLNLGCGTDYRIGWVNLDFNKRVKTDAHADINKKLPFKDNTFDYVFAHHVLEQVKDFFKVMDEVYRIRKPNAIIEVYSPYFTSIYSRKYAFRYQSFGIGSFIMFTDKSDNKQKYGKAKFEVLKEELHLFLKGSSIKSKLLNVFNPFFNLSKKWQQVWERLFVFGFDEVYYKLRVVK